MPKRTFTLAPGTDRVEITYANGDKEVDYVVSNRPLETVTVDLADGQQADDTPPLPRERRTWTNWEQVVGDYEDVDDSSLIMRAQNYQRGGDHNDRYKFLRFAVTDGDDTWDIDITRDNVTDMVGRLIGWLQDTEPES